MLTRLGEEMTKASAAQTTSTMTIDTVTDADTDSGASRYVVWGPSGITDHDEYAGKERITERLGLLKVVRLQIRAVKIMQN